ncbi:MAG: hypothetical protein WCH20_10760 [Nitrospira sp.]
MLLNAPRIALLCLVPDHFPEIQPSEQEAPDRRRTPGDFKANGISRGRASFIVQETSDRNHTLPFSAEPKDLPNNGGLLLIDPAFDVIALWPAVSIQHRGMDLHVVIPIHAPAGHMSHESFPMKGVEGSLLSSGPFAFVHQAGDRQPHLVHQVVEYDLSVIQIGEDSHPGEHELFEDMSRFDGLTAEPRLIHHDEVLKRGTAFEGFYETLKSWPTGKLSSADAIVFIDVLIGDRPSSTCSICPSTSLLPFH